MPTILVVDDRQESRDFLVTLLQYGGHRLIEARDGAEALVVVTNEHPDLVIADIIMPTMDGYEFVRQLRLSPDVAHTAVIFYTAAYHRLEAAALADAAGAVQLLTKPSDPEIILEAVTAALARQPTQGQTPLPDSFEREHLRLVTDMLAQKVNELEVVNLRMTALIQLGQQLVQEHNSARLLEKFCHAARDVIAAKYAVVTILSEDRTSQLHFFSSGLDAAVAAQIGPPPSIRGLLRRILFKNTSIRVRDVASEPDVTGFPPNHPQIGSFLCVPIATQARQYGALYLGNKIGMAEFTEDDERAAATLAAQLAVAYENGYRIEVIEQHAAQLEQEISDRKQAEEELLASQLRLEVLSRQLITTQETERRHLARELHDEIGQVLTAIKMNLQNAQRTADPVAQVHLIESIGMVDRSIDRVRNLSLSLRPPQLDELGLVAALHWYMKQQARLAGFQEHLVVTPAEIVASQDLATTCFRITQESLTNAIRHGHPSNVYVELRQSDTELRLTIRDDGVGFDVNAAHQRAKRSECLGLLGMQERAHLAGGHLTIDSGPGSGTTIRALFPQVN